MYKLTDIMLQNFEKSLIEFHKLFQGGRCQAWQLEELLAKAIRSDFSVAEKVTWKGNGHDIDADIIVNDSHYLQVKSGKIKNKNYLEISGHRLGRFQGDFEKIKNFLNKSSYIIVSIPYEEAKDSKGIIHTYKIFYVPPNIMNITNGFSSEGKSYVSINENKVVIKIHPSMSWQVWWKIPLYLLDIPSREIVIS